MTLSQAARTLFLMLLTTYGQYASSETGAPNHTAVNKAVIAAAHHSVVFFCTRYLSRGRLEDPSVEATIELTRMGSILSGLSATWQLSSLPVKDAKPFVPGKTKFVSVGGFANWHSADGRSPSFDLRDGMLRLTMEAGPSRWGHVHPVVLSAKTPDGRPVPGETFASMMRKEGRVRSKNNSQSDRIDIRWADVARFGLDKTGLNLVLMVDGEVKPRMYFVEPYLLKVIPAEIVGVAALVRADAHDYMARCQAQEQIPIIN